MREVILSIPNWEAEQNLEIDVRINGKKQTLNYRIEIVNWEGTEPDSKEKVTVMKHFIEDYDEGWELLQIGTPKENHIPLMFRKRSGSK